MSMTERLIDALKIQMKRQGLTYKDAAGTLEIAEVSVKRLFSEKSFTLRRLEKLCELAEIDMSELMELAEQQVRKISQLTVEQEKEIVENPKLLLVGVCIMNRYTFEEILGKYRIDKPELISLFVKLDRLNILELLPQNRYRLKISVDFKWNRNGPIQQFFMESLVSEYLRNENDADETPLHLVWGMLTRESIMEINQKIQRLLDDYVQMSNHDVKHPTEDKQTSSMLIMFKKNWEPSAFKAYWQDKYGLRKTAEK